MTSASLPLATVSVPPSRVPRPRVLLEPGSRLQKGLLALGVAAPLLFTSAYLAEGATRAGYSPLRDTISQLSLGPDGWMQVANFILFGLLVIVSTPAWRAALRGGRGATLYPSIRVAQGLGLILAGLFVTAPTGAAGQGSGPLIHNLASYVALGGTWVGVFVLAARFAREPGWRGWAVAAVASGVLSIAMLVGLGISFSFGAAGLFERLASVATLPLGFCVGVRLLAGDGRVSRSRRDA